MSIKSQASKTRLLALASLLVVAVLGWGSTAQAQYLLTASSGGQLQIGTGLPLPATTIFPGGKTPGAASSFPPLLVPPASNISTNGGMTVGVVTRTIMQDLATKQGGAVAIPPAALALPAAGVVGGKLAAGLLPTNPGVFQVATSITYAWPAASATFMAGGGPGIPGDQTAVTPVGVTFTVAGAVGAYFGGPKAFGGAARFMFTAGPLSAMGRVGLGGPMGTTPPIASVWINFFKKGGATATMALVAGALATPAGLAQPGAMIASPPNTTMFGTLSLPIGLISATPAGAILMSTPVPAGTPTTMIAMSLGIPLSNGVIVSKGFPWTTGFLSLFAPPATPMGAPEVFFLSGTDARLASTTSPGMTGVGNLSLVSTSLSVRALSGFNANRGWLSLTLPEPTMVAGAGAALAMLALCHGLVRRRSR